MSRIGALQLRDAVLDEGSFRSWDTAPLEVATNDAYRRERAAASCLDESVLTGEGTVFGRRVALVACELDFLARSIGMAERLPLLPPPSSGGTRMQEGTVAFLQMVKIASPSSSCTNGRTCATWSTCAIPPPSGCSPPGFAGVTSPPRDRARSSGSALKFRASWAGPMFRGRRLAQLCFPSCRCTVHFPGSWHMRHRTDISIGITTRNLGTPPSACGRRCAGVLGGAHGPSTNPKDKRLARRTEDHPLDCETFEGVIAEGKYGAGRVIVWDRGTYINESRYDMSEGLKRGHLSFWLDGQKLRGGYALTRIRDGVDETWLLGKKSDEYADARSSPVRSQPESVLSGRSLADLS